MVMGIASSASALPSPITFSEFPVGTVIDDEYASLGVLFSPGGDGTLPVIDNDGAMPGSPILRPDGADYAYAGDFRMVFPTPVTKVSFQSGYWDAIGTGVIDLFDPSLTLIGSFTNTVTGPEDMSFSGLGLIGAVYFDSGNDVAGADIDNLDFTPVPEPGTLLLVGVGLAGLAARSRRSGRKG